MTRIIIIVIGFLGLILMLSALIVFDNSSEIKIDYIQTSGPNGWDVSFSYFKGVDGREMTFAQSGQVVLIYEMDLEKGALEIRVKDHEGNQVAHMNGGSGEVALTVGEEQVYAIEVEGKEAKGSYRISWNTSSI